MTHVLGVILLSSLELLGIIIVVAILVAVTKGLIKSFKKGNKK